MRPADKPRVSFRIALFVMLVLPGIVVGCAGGASGPAFTHLVPEPGTGLIYIYRVGKMIGGNNVYYLSANEELITRVGNGGYFWLMAPPGNTTFATRLKPSVVQLGAAFLFAMMEFEEVITIPVEADEIYFVRFDYYGQGELVTPEIGVTEIRELKRFDPATE
jgi:hypothetical protein